MLKLLLLICGFLTAVSVHSQNGGSISRSTLGAFGSTVFNDGLLVRHTVGQPPGTDVLSDDQGFLRQGFQQPVEHPSVTSSPLPFFDDLPGRFGFVIYPNPARDQVFIVLDIADGSALEVIITDIHGKRVYHQGGIISSNISVNLQVFRPGVYFVTVVSSSGRETRKLLVL